MCAETNIVISVLMTVYNQSISTIFRAIDSVYYQDFNLSYELIIVDDGSLDEIGEAIKTYIKDKKLSIKYIKQKNQGQANALNNAFINSKGSYIAIIDADDQYCFEHLSQNHSQISKYMLVHSEADIVADDEDDFLVPDKHELLKMVNIKDCVVMGTIFGKREVFEKIIFQEHRALDAIFFEKAEKLYPQMVIKIPTKTYIYYRNSISSKINKIKAESWFNNKTYT